MSNASAKPNDLLWRLLEQTDLGAARSMPSQCIIDTSVITRGFEAIYFGIDPHDQTRGTRWVSYDTAQGQIVTLIDDVNDACGQLPAVGKLGHRVTACVHGDVLGTGPAKGVGKFLGGQILRRGRSIGKLPAGWRVIRFDPCWPLANVYLNPDPLDAIALACDAEEKKFQLFHVMSDAIRALAITGGPELNRFFAWNEDVIFPAGAKGHVMRSRIVSSGRTELVTDAGLIARASGDYIAICRGTSGQFGGFRPLPRQQFMLAPDGSLTSFIFPEGPAAGLLPSGTIAPHLSDVTPFTIDQWSRSEMTRWYLEKGRQIDDPRPTDPAVIIFARQGIWPDIPATIHALIPGEYEEPIQLGPITDTSDRVFHVVHHVRVMPSGEVAVIVGSREVNAIQIYAAPILDRFTDRLSKHINRVVSRASVPETRCETLASLYEFGPQHDRGYGCAAFASDGAIHFSSMPHHPRLGASLFRFDPRPDGHLAGVELLGDFDRLAGNLGVGDIPSMIHTPPVEVHGRLLWVGQDPFYGVHDFPGMTPLTYRYRGSPVLNYDLDSRRFELMGIPLPGRESLFELFADFKGEELFFREGYHSSRWFRQRIDQRFRFERAPEPLPLVDALRVSQCSDGQLAYVTPERNHWPEDSVPPAMLRVFDPGKNESRDIARLSAQAMGVGGDDRWSIVHDMRPDDSVLVINDAGAILSVSLDTGKVRAIAHALELQDITGQGVMVSQISLHDAANDRVFALRSVTRPFVLVSVCVTDLNTGHTKNLGILRDQHGRPMQSVSFAVLHNGVVYYSGFSWGRAKDDHYIRRQAFTYIARVDTVFGRWVAPSV